MKEINFTVEITAKIDDNVDPKDVSIEIDLSRTFPVTNGHKTVGRSEKYQTTDYHYMT